MASAIQIIIVLIIGSVVIVNGISAKTDDILASAQKTANITNIRQLSAALELYYLDHNAYPSAADGRNLVNILFSEQYIKNKPLDADAFIYKPTSSGQDYELALK